MYRVPEENFLNPDPLLSVRQAAEYLNVSKSKMYEIINTEGLPTVLIGDIKIQRSILDEYINKRKRTWHWMSVDF
jgi:excisionase family DNA binding protein